MSIAPQSQHRQPTAIEAEAGDTPPTQSFFGASLLPALSKACHNRLSDLNWFRTDWQRGGALTGYARWQSDDHTRHDVVVKLPVPPQELRWMQRLQTDGVEDPAIGAAGQHDASLGDPLAGASAQPAPGATPTDAAGAAARRPADAVPVVPRLYAAGVELGGYDLAWLVMERLPFGPLDGGWHGAEFDLLVDAAARFQAAAARYEVDCGPPQENWPQLFDQARKSLRDVVLPDTQRWNVALKSLKKKFKTLLRRWDARDCTTWCHGDLHLANAMTHAPAPAGPALLFDLARVHPGHWVEDAVYFEHLFWSVPQRVNGHDPVKTLSRRRKELGLPVEPDWPQLANIRRLLLAIGDLAAQSRRPDPARSSAALATVERLLPSL